MWPNPQEPAELVTFTEEMINGKLNFLCSVNKCYYWIIIYFLCSFIQNFSMICISFLTRLHQRNIALSFQVSLIAQQPSIVYVWSRQNILKIFKNDNVIKNVFDSLVGKDICKKLFSVHKKLLLNESKKTSPILYQAPLVTYSTGTFIGILFCCIWLSCPWLSVRYTFSFQKLRSECSNLLFLYTNSNSLRHENLSLSC